LSPSEDPVGGKFKARCLSQCLVRVKPVIQFHLAERPNIVMALHLSGRTRTMLVVTS